MRTQASLKISVWEADVFMLTRQQALTLPRDSFVALLRAYLMKVQALAGMHFCA